MPGSPRFLLQSLPATLGLPCVRKSLQRVLVMDAFSEVLSAVKLKGALFFNAEFASPWGLAAPRSDFLAPALLPGAEHLIIFHLLIEGSAFVQLDDGRPIGLSAGDIVIFPHGDSHKFGNGAPTQVLDGEAMLALIRCRGLGGMRAGGSGEVSRFVCGYMACDPQLCRPILAGLPRVLKVNVRSGASGRWLEASILRLVDEVGSAQPGSQAMLAKLSEALFVETLRQYVGALPAEETGWLAGARDEVVGKSLAILHSRVDHPWTIAELSKEVGMSRSALLERFARYLSEPPMAYLTRWRLQLAARRLTSTPRSVAQISGEVGYESEAAFSRAFKREFGSPPAKFRRASRTQPIAASGGSRSHARHGL
jgi:AraC-like DNA-binding protein